VAGAKARWNGLSVVEARRFELTFRPILRDLADVKEHVLLFAQSRSALVQPGATPADDTATVNP
jgi:hypothetical protein